VDLVIIDNCNATVSEMKPYAQMVGAPIASSPQLDTNRCLQADERGYTIEIKEMDTPWAWKVTSLRLWGPILVLTR